MNKIVRAAKSKLFLLLPAVMFITSCADMNDQFDCPMKSGIRCESIDTVNAQVDHGDFNGANPIGKMPIYKESPMVSTTRYKGTAAPLRHRETTERVWVAPFEDKEGNYHSESEIDVVTKPGYWSPVPFKETNDEGEA